MRAELSHDWLRALQPPPGQRLEIRDTGQPGLVVRITSAGVVSWAARGRRQDGREARVTLGTWPKVALSEARRGARAALVALANGADPVAEKRALRAARKERARLPTVAACLADWQAANKRRWSPRYAAEVDRLAKRELIPQIGERPLREIDRASWTKLLSAAAQRAPALGASLYRVTASFLSHADAHGWIAEHPLPRRGASRIAPSVASRERVLSDDELSRLWAATAAMHPGPQCFVRLLMTTGCRVSEAGGIAAGELDTAAGIWRLPADRAKNDRTHVMPIPPALMAALRARVPAGDPDRLAGCRLLGRTRGGALSGFSKIKRELDRAAGVTGWRFHDLRRTVRTRLAAAGVPAEVAERCLNHQSADTLARIYHRHDHETEILTALRGWQATLAGLVESKPTAPRRAA